MAHADLGAPALAGFDRRAIVVLTDGQENRAQYIADIAALIDDQVPPSAWAAPTRSTRWR